MQQALGLDLGHQRAKPRQAKQPPMQSQFKSRIAVGNRRGGDQQQQQQTAGQGEFLEQSRQHQQKPHHEGRLALKAGQQHLETRHHEAEQKRH